MQIKLTSRQNALLHAGVPESQARHGRRGAPPRPRPPEKRRTRAPRRAATTHASCRRYPQVDYNATDGDASLCAAVNGLALAWAEGAAAPATLARFKARGLPLRWTPDHKTYWGPGFTDGSVRYELDNSTGTAPFVWVNATGFTTPIPFVLPVSAGFHYCLLMSPARAMEWIYTDSLRSFLLE